MTNYPAPFQTSDLFSSIVSEKFSIKHGFFSRDGGVSQDHFASLNVGLGSSDHPPHVIENRRRCEVALHAQKGSLKTLHQIHSDRVVTMNGSSNPIADGPVQADALVTNQPGIMLGVLAADCMPFLFADPVAGIIGAAHAGWRGALSGILDQTIRAMTKLGANPMNIHACLGPCLRQPNFEVGFDLVSEFLEKYPQTERFFLPGKNDEKRQLDLASFGFWRLCENGVFHTDDIGICTLANPDQYFSYRHSRQVNAPDYGRNLSAIVISLP